MGTVAAAASLQVFVESPESPLFSLYPYLNHSLFLLHAGCCRAMPTALQHEQPAAAADPVAAAPNRRSLQQVPIGAIVGGVQAGVNVGLDAVAPVVNNLASNIPIMVPSFQGQCLKGQPVAPFKSNPEQIWCIVASGAEFTDGFFRAFSGLTSVAANAAGMFFGH